MIKSLKKTDTAPNMDNADWLGTIKAWPKNVIASNGKLKKTNFWQWSIPAFTATIERGGKSFQMHTCPTAGDCAKLCYAQQGNFMFSNTKIAHHRNLQAFFDDPTQLAMDLVDAIGSKRNLEAFRVHDSGDFFSIAYTRWWFAIIRELPNIQFYAYTKRVKMFKGALKNEIPDNLSLIFSYGGREDKLIDPTNDRHSRVFPTQEEMIQSGYHDTYETDANAADPAKRCIGLVYHGVLSKAKAFSDADMGQNDA